MAKKKEKKVDIDKMLANEVVYDVPIAKTIRNSTLNYAMSVITDRALPDVRDGCKPIQRKVLYATYVKKIFPNSKFTKNAEIVGEVIGKYSPHGDTSTYGALVNLAQPWNTKYPLIDFHGRQ